MLQMKPKQNLLVSPVCLFCFVLFVCFVWVVYSFFISVIFLTGGGEETDRILHFRFARVIWNTMYFSMTGLTNAVISTALSTNVHI